MKFKIGDKVKFKDYSKFQDHRDHEGQVATVCDSFTEFIRVKWSDGRTSRATFSHITKPYRIHNKCKDIDSKLFKI